jgi:hypothetical protein
MHKILRNIESTRNWLHSNIKTMPEEDQDWLMELVDELTDLLGEVRDLIREKG